MAGCFSLWAGFKSIHESLFPRLVAPWSLPFHGASSAGAAITEIPQTGCLKQQTFLFFFFFFLLVSIHFYLFIYLFIYLLNFLFCIAVYPINNHRHVFPTIWGTEKSEIMVPHKSVSLGSASSFINDCLLCPHLPGERRTLWALVPFPSAPPS